MKQTLQLKLTQHLTLTPQLQQSIRLLQLSTLELNAEVDRMLQENPLLEREEGEDEAPPQEADEDTLTEVDRVPAIQTMVVPPERAGELAAEAETEPEEPKERLSVQAARVILSLAVVAGLALLVWWLLGQSQ